MVAIRPADKSGRFFVTGHFFRFGIEVYDPANLGGDIPEMAERRGEVTDFDIGVGLLTVPDAVQEVLVMVGEREGAFHALSRLVAFQDHLPARFLAEDHHPLGAVEGVAVFVSLLKIRGPDPLFKNQLSRAQRTHPPGIQR